MEIAVDGDVRVRAALPLPEVASGGVGGRAAPEAGAAVRRRRGVRASPSCVTVGRAEPWAPRGFELARVQVVLPDRSGTPDDRRFADRDEPARWR